MTDKEIMLGIKYCHDKEAGCDYCPYAIYLAKDCDTNLMNDALDLINRQQAEIEKLKSDVFGMDFATAMYKAISESARAKAVKEFAKRLKATFPPREDERCTLDDCYTLDCIDRIAEEMGADNE